MTVGGWSLVHSWLQDGIESKNWPLVQELLELLLLCPVDVPRLQSNSAPKLVKGLSREEENDGKFRTLRRKQNHFHIMNISRKKNISLLKKKITKNDAK